MTAARDTGPYRRCAYCRKLLTSRYVVDTWGNASCPEHHVEWPACRWCQRLVPEAEGTAAPRVSCRACRAAAVMDDASAAILIPPLVTWLRAEGVTLERSVRLLVDLVERSELQAGSSDGPDVLGQARVVRQGATPSRVALLLLRGLPSPHFESVAIHELGHAWLACRGIVGLALDEEEGFCQVLAHRWLTWRDTAESRFYADLISRNADPVYGAGYRAVRRLVDEWGFVGVIGNLMARGRLPGARP